jgi:hypothetical protein
VKQNRDTDSDFEQRLLDELKTVVAERGAKQAIATEGATSTPVWRRAPRLFLGAVAVLAAAAAVLVFSSGGDNPPRAFAVEPQAGGGVTIKVYSLEDASGLEQALEEAGIKAQVTWLSAGMTCREPHFTPSIVHLPGGGTLGGMTMGGPEPMTFGVGSTRQWRKRIGGLTHGAIPADQDDESIPNLNLDPEAFRPDQSVVLSGAPAPYGGDPEGGSVAHLGIAEGPVEPCKPVTMPDGGGPFGLPQSAGGGPGYTPIGEALRHSAAAEALHRTATLAAASRDRAEAPPAPGQFLYTKTKVVELQGWLPEGPGTGSKTNPRYFTAHIPGNYPDAPAALVSTLKEVWTAPGGKTHVRETLGGINFFSDADQRHWEAAGSPPPWAFDPREHDVRRGSSGRFVKEFGSKSWRGPRVFSHVSQLAEAPTEPEALRLAIEHRRRRSSPVAPSPANSLRGGSTVERLLEILSEPIASPALRAAAFDALAEIPGVGLERDVADGAGRRGDAIAWIRERGFGREYIFDPHTSEMLAQAEMIFKAKAAGYPGVADGTVFRETAYLRSRIVDSADETAADVGGGPVATTSAGHRK